MNEFARGARIKKDVRYDSSLQAYEAAAVTIELYKKEQPNALAGDFMRYMLKVWDAWEEAGRTTSTSKDEHG